MSDKAGPFIFQGSLTGAESPTEENYTTQPKLGDDTLFDDMRRAWALLYRAGVIHQGLNADMLDNLHASDFQLACDLLTAICAETTNGIIVKNGSASDIRTIAAGNGIAVTNGDGVSGNPTVAWNPDTLPEDDIALDSWIGFGPDGDLANPKRDTVGDMLSLSPTSKRVTTTETLDNAAFAVFCDTDGGAFTLSLDASPADGKGYRIANCGSNTLTIDSAGGDNIKGFSSLTLPAGSIAIVYFNPTEAWW